jgi:hypothetical protein
MTAQVKPPQQSFFEELKHLRQHRDWLDYLWGQHQVLYRQGEEPVNLLNKSAPAFFGMTQRLIVDAVILGLCRLQDQATFPAAGQNQSNLTLAHLIRVIKENGAEALSIELEADRKALWAKGVSLRRHRNKRLGHFDLDTATGDSTLDPIFTKDVDATLDGLHNFIAKIVAKYEPEISYAQHPISPAGDASAFLDRLERAIHDQELRRDLRTRAIVEPVVVTVKAGELVLTDLSQFQSP